MKTCIICGSPLPKHHSKTCSRECYKTRARIKRNAELGAEHDANGFKVAICVECGTEFNPLAGSITCSEECRKIRANRRAREKARMASPYQRERKLELARKRWKNSSHYRQYQNERRLQKRGPPTARTCETCGLEFMPQRMHPQYRFCSEYCAKESRLTAERLKRRSGIAEREIAENVAMTTLALSGPKPTLSPAVCSLCGRTFTAKNQNQIYCSEECRFEQRRLRRPPVGTIDCIVCGQTFVPRSRRVTICSPECRFIRRKHILRRHRRQKAARRELERMNVKSNAPIIVQPQSAEIATETTEHLRERLTGLLAKTAENLVEMATIVRELENRGEDLSSLKLGFIDHLRRIAAGQLLPEIVVRFSGFPAMLRIATRLPLADQKRLADGDQLDLAVWRGDRIETRRVDPLSLTQDQVSILFASDRIRRQDEQVSILETRRERRLSKPQTDKPAKSVAKADPERFGIVVGRRFVPAADVLDVLGELQDRSTDDDDDSPSTMLAVSMSASDHKRLKVSAANSGTTVADIVRKALRAAGLI